MELRLTNSLSKVKTSVVPAQPDGILRIYHCGPTVYSTPHLGNLRRFLVADLLVRTARVLGYRVRSVMNITDVGHLLENAPLVQSSAGQDPTSLVQSSAGQDRMLVAAQREGVSPEQIAAKYTAEFFAALAELHAESADYFPRATMHVPQMQALIQRLLDRGKAYVTSSGVYFDVTSFPPYGKLSGNTLEAIQSGLPAASSPQAMRAGARIETREDKQHPADFALWVCAPEGHLLQWNSPWGRGYPGWHIECSAMSMQLLGETLDIHTGGQDNIFPHHENEIAQSEGATGKPFTGIWVHNEFLELHGAKMSKSEGETLTLKDLADRGLPPLAFRLLCLQTHYRSKLTFSWESLSAAVSALGSLREFARRLQEVAHRAPSSTFALSEQLGKRLASLEGDFLRTLADDLGSPQALAALFAFVREINPSLQAGTLSPSDSAAIRISLRKFDKVLAVLDVDAPLPSPDVPANIDQLVTEREEARHRQDFATADRLRADLNSRGYTIEDTSTGPRITKTSG